MRIRTSMVMIGLTGAALGFGAGWEARGGSEHAEPSTVSTGAGESTAGAASPERPPAGSAETTAGTTGAFLVGSFAVYSVHDGDTIRVCVAGDTCDIDGSEQVRLLGIDAPEISPNLGRPVQCYSKEAQKAAKALIGFDDKKDTVERVTLAADPLNQDKDDHGRYLRQVIVADGRNFSEAMVAAGAATVYREFPVSNKNALYAAEHEASARQLGLWGVCNIPPEAIPADGNETTEVSFTPGTYK